MKRKTLAWKQQVTLKNTDLKSCVPGEVSEELNFQVSREGEMGKVTSDTVNFEKADCSTAEASSRSTYLKKENQNFFWLVWKWIYERSQHSTITKTDSDATVSFKQNVITKRELNMVIDKSHDTLMAEGFQEWIKWHNLL